MPAIYSPPYSLPELVALLAPDQAHRRTAGQALAVSQTRGGAVALIGNGHLAMANFGARQATAAFAFPRAPQAAVPVFAGITRIDHGPHDREHPNLPRSANDQISKKKRLAAVWGSIA